MKYPRALSILQIHLQRAPILQWWQDGGGIFQRQCMVSTRADRSLGYRLAPGRPEPQARSHCTHTRRRPTDRGIKEIISHMRHGILELRGILYIQTISRIRKLAVKRDETCPKSQAKGKKKSQRTLTPPAHTSFIMTSISCPSSDPTPTPTTPQQEKSGSSKSQANANGSTDLRLYSHCFPQT